MRTPLLSIITLALLLTNVRAASADVCLFNGPPYQLTSDSVDWSMRIGNGQSCVRGLRLGSAVLETIKLVSGPQSGNVTVLGPGFRYTTKPNFHGEDSFTIEVSGVSRKVHGTSTIHFKVLVVEGSPPSGR